MRRLSAIMFTDMVGYSALTQKNEALALDLLEEHRKILRPFFDKHDGREIDTAGDSFFVEFKSAVESTNCAIEIQTNLYERNKNQPADRQILIRIGLHIGDVVYVDDQVHGDGVNIAARMEHLAQPGGICISEDVARQIRNKIEFPVIKLGAEKLKNISMPMDIYCIGLPWLHAGKHVKKVLSVKKIVPYFIGLLVLLVLIAGFYMIKNYEGKKDAHSKLRLAVLPLSNISNDVKDEYFADGMTEELISGLSKIAGLNVIARTSIMKYKDTDKDISKIGQELMVGSILEGSVRKFENKARVTVQLIDVLTQEHIWSMDYDRELKDIFSIQSEIARNVADELKVRLLSSEKELLEKGNTTDMIAFQEYLIGKHFLNQRTSESIQTALLHFEKSIKQDSTFALPYASLAYAYTLIGVAGYGNTPRIVAETKAKEAVMKALAIDETLAEAHAALGYIKLRIDWDWKGAETELKRAIALKPGDATSHEWYALFLAIQVRLDEALKEMKKAYDLDPLSPSVNTGLARIYHFRNETGKAIAQIKKTLELDPNYAEAYFTEGMAYYKEKNFQKAVSVLEKAVELSGRRPVMLAVLGASFGKIGKKEEMKKLQAELESPPVTNDKLYASSFIKSSLGQYDEAFAILEKLLADRYGIMIYMKVEKNFFGGTDNPRFQKMIDKMGF
ncbi:MAG: adenylate/guanylate cyclase domain-containing protein [Chitinophagaceae bacterium]